MANIEGAAPSLRDLPGADCAFAPRCTLANALASDVCWRLSPPMAPFGPGASIACHHVETIADAAQ